MNSNLLTQDQLNSVNDLYLKGNIKETIKLIDSLIIENPNESILFNLLGACQLNQEEFENAIQNFTKAISLNPEYSEAHFNLGEIYYRLNQLTKSINCLNKTLTINPNFVEANNVIGKIYQEKDKHTDAILEFTKVLKAYPDFAEVHYNIALSFNYIGKKNLAIEHYEKCIELNPNSIVAQNNLGKIYQDTEKYNLAATYFEKVIELDPTYAEAYNNLGSVLHNLGQLNDAIHYYETSISLNPDAITYNNLGVALQEIGKIDKAAESFQKAIIQDPDSSDSYHNLSYLADLSKSDLIIQKMKQIHSNQTLKLSERSLICLALAKVYETKGNIKYFFKYLHEGNALRKKELQYSIKEHTHEIKAIKKIFSSNNPPKDNSFLKNPGKKIIFILGMPRSGTTLVEQIISSHNKVYGAGELNTLTKLVKPLINNFIEDEKSEISHKAISFIQQEYTDMLSDLNFSENIVTDKLPLNFLYVGFILKSFPNAKIIHLKRDAIATCWSNYRCSFTSRANGYSYNFDDLIKFYSLYEDLMEFWNRLYPNKIYELSYENLTENQETETQNLLNYCGLEWDENCLNFHKNKRGVQTASTIQVRKKMYQGSSKEWKKYWTFLQPLIDGIKSKN